MGLILYRGGRCLRTFSKSFTHSCPRPLMVSEWRAISNVFDCTVYLLFLYKLKKEDGQLMENKVEHAESSHPLTRLAKLGVWHWHI